MILAVPADTAVTNPDASTVAKAVLLLLHAPVPPLSTTPMAWYVAVAPIQSGEVPEIDATAGSGLTSIGIVAGSGALQPVTV